MLDSSLTFLIVCSDDRCTTLARVLAGAGNVYRVIDGPGAVVYEVWQSQQWTRERDEEETPQVFAALFFHTGQGDWARVPSDRTYRNEFAFSSAGVSSAFLAEMRDTALPIERPFTSNRCPVKEHHLNELTQFIARKRHERPSFCTHGDEVPTLWAIIIMCDAYVAAGIAAKANSLDAAFRGDVYPEHFLQETAFEARHDLARLWPNMHDPSWWHCRLAIWDTDSNRVDERAYRTLLLRLAMELEIIDDIITEQESDTQAEALTVAQLEAGICKHRARFPKGPPVEIVAFLKSDKPWCAAHAAFTKTKEILGT